jgi:hypothetical protein
LRYASLFHYFQSFEYGNGFSFYYGAVPIQPNDLCHYKTTHVITQAPVCGSFVQFFVKIHINIALVPPMRRILTRDTYLAVVVVLVAVYHAATARLRTSQPIKFLL